MIINFQKGLRLRKFPDAKNCRKKSRIISLSSKPVKQKYTSKNISFPTTAESREQAFQ